MSKKFNIKAYNKKLYIGRVHNMAVALQSKSTDYILGHMDACLDCRDLFDLDPADDLTLQIVIDACSEVLESRNAL